MQFSKRNTSAATVLVASALVLAACGSSSSSGGGSGGSTSSSPPASSSGGGSSSGPQVNKQFYFTDGNTADYSGTFPAGTLNGVKGTYPGAKLTGDFRKRLLSINPKLKEFTYGPESYDAVVVSALAATAAKSDASKAIAKQMQAVSAGGKKCTSFKVCAAMIKKGVNIDYDGVSGPIDFNSTGSPSAATIDINQFGKDNNYKTLSYVTGQIPDTKPNPKQQVTGPIGKGDGTFTVGTLLPQTGDLAFLGPPEFAGVALAIKDINAAGGVLGKPAVEVKADSGDNTPPIAPASVDKLLNAHSDIIVGAASSDVSLSVIDKIINAGVLEISPANTSTAFDTYPDHGLYFRTAPSDVLQGRVLADLVAQDGFSNIAIMFRQDAYGQALSANVKKDFTAAGGKVVSFVPYAPDAADFSAEVDKIKSSQPDAIVLIAFDETKKIIPLMVKAGIGPNK